VIDNKKDFELSSYDYELDPKLIAQKPIEPRHNARLMLVGDKDKDSQLSIERKVWDLIDEFNPGDLIVLNDTRVLKARLRVRFTTGRQGELLVLEPCENGSWLCLARPGRKFRPGDCVILEKGNNHPIELQVISNHSSTGGKIVQFPSKYSNRKEIEELLMLYGEVPLPPYIKKQDSINGERYQTRYAANPGAVAAPTAGLHFSDELLKGLKQKGVFQQSVTLHVGLGTFRPLETDDLTDLKLHSEWVQINEEVVAAIHKCHLDGGRVFAIGTTCVRALESAFQLGGGKLKPINSKVDLVIKPGYRFGVVDGLLTNFHLPRSSLLLLVSALVGRERLLTLYKEAIKSQYRFFSYGDAMLIKPEAVLSSARNSSYAGC
tara:strand:- start:3268 stop:4398 length:1131 start_codon:yes stop_codon:yes gene_type:complete